MTVPKPVLIDDTGWQVPSHDVALYGEKRHRHALVIPVINEGERIRGQLERIKTAALPVDVIVADGGSTDGSLDPEFVEPVGVRAVLTKTGPGKLSAQLRMAYAWCLQQGYAGIVTVDGNGKDGVEAVADMVAKLDQGYDYVQGSRYLPGGVAENTPLERTIANRFIHAPLLSIAGKHWFGDTTNGFRAYSARYLTHPEVRPFRDEFQVYGLLFYLTVRAGQLGMKVGHVPVARRYPDSGKVPTKIGGLASKLALLGETVHAATGGYTPDEAVRRWRSLLWPLLVALLVTLPLLLAVMDAPPYSPDSWAFYELSKTVLGDFYRFEHFRSYSSTSPYSSAFPPLWPSLIAVADAILGTGSRTGLYLAFASFVGFALASEVIGRRVSGAAWLGLSAALLMLLGPKMLLTEMSTGRTIPLQMLLYAFVLLGLRKGEGTGSARALGIGFVAGLAVLNRFDGILLPPLVAVLTAWMTRSPLRGLIALFGAAVAVSPWIAYSLATFATPFATDNSGIATTLDTRAFVTDWWPTPQPTLADDPAAWFARIASHVGGLTYNGLSLVLSPIGAGMVIALLPLAGLQYIASRRPGAVLGFSRIAQDIRLVLAFVAILAVMLLPQVLIGYVDLRYFSPLFWAGFLLLAVALVRSGATRPQRSTFGVLVAVPAVVVTAVFALLSYTRAPSIDRFAFESPAALSALESCVQSDREARILVIGDDTFAAKAGALSGLHTMMEPRNMAEGRLGREGSRAFAAEWNVGYVFVKNNTRKDWARSTFDLSAVPGCPLPLYRLGRATIPAS